MHLLGIKKKGKRKGGGVEKTKRKKEGGRKQVQNLIQLLQHRSSQRDWELCSTSCRAECIIDEGRSFSRLLSLKLCVNSALDKCECIHVGTLKCQKC